MRVLATMALVALAAGGPVDRAPLRMLVSGLPWEVVWAEAIQSLGARYPLAKVGEGVIFTAPVERPPRPEQSPAEAGAERAREQVTLWVEPFGDRLTQVSVRIDLEVLRDGQWSPVPAGEETARAVLAAIRDLGAGRPR